MTGVGGWRPLPQADCKRQLSDAPAPLLGTPISAQPLTDTVPLLTPPPTPVPCFGKGLGSPDSGPQGKSPLGSTSSGLVFWSQECFLLIQGEGLHPLCTLLRPLETPDSAYPTMGMERATLFTKGTGLPGPREHAVRRGMMGTQNPPTSSCISKPSLDTVIPSPMQMLCEQLLHSVVKVCSCPMQMQFKITFFLLEIG